MAAFIATLPPRALLLVVLGWTAGAWGGAWLAGRVAGRAPMTHAMIVAALLLIATVANLATLPHPTWMWVAGVVLVPWAGYVGGRTASTRGS